MRCEKFVNEYLPAVKAKIAYILYYEYDMKQVKISQVLDITQPAVSQYLSGNRGKTTELSEDIEKAIEEVSKEIYDLSESCTFTGKSRQYDV
ncbi:MAG: transcriptional regulator [Thermoplasmata archaeon]